MMTRLTASECKRARYVLGVFPLTVLALAAGFLRLAVILPLPGHDTWHSHGAIR